LGTPSRSSLILPIVGFVAGCQLVAGIEDITYVPAEASSAAADKGSSGSAPMPVESTGEDAFGSSQAPFDAAASGSSYDATSDATADSRDTATSDVRSNDAPSESALDSSPDASSGNSKDAGDSSTSCSNPLGAVWSETEANGTCISTWTRQGTTSMFTDNQGPPCNVTASLTITVTGSSVSVDRTNSSDGNDCTYTGMLSADCMVVVGTYTCSKDNGSSGKWSATIAP
jgi:hypothetical protein